MRFYYDGYTRFEKSRILSARTLQIAMGAPVLAKAEGTPMEIARREFEEGVIPITVKRELPTAVEEENY